MHLYVANWKMNLTEEEAIRFVKGLIPQLRQADGDVMVCPPSLYLPIMAKLVDGTRLSIGCQNAHYEKSGAFTGEISMGMVAQFCNTVLVGHSERRHLFGENDEMVNKKVLSALAHGLRPIICVGETLAQREAGKAEEVVRSQLKGALDYVPSFENITIAYEPVWAIGTGKTASPTDAQAMHKLIRDELSAKKAICKILYGGSVNPDNTASLLSQQDIDGLLVGGASLDLESFAWIIRGGKLASN